MALKNAIERAFLKKIKGNGWHKWPRMFWAVDLHDVIIPGTYTKNNEGRELYPNAEEVLKWLTNRKDMCLILFTSSHTESATEMRNWLKEKGIVFDYFNENPECANNELCDFKTKFYFDMLLEDKAGFEGMEDWLVIKETLIGIDQWGKAHHND